MDKFVKKSTKWMGSSHKHDLKLFKFTSRRVHYQVHKWTRLLVHKVDELKLLSPQVDEFIFKSTSGWINYSSPKMDEFVKKSTKWTRSSHKHDLKLFKSTSGRVHYQVHKWTRLLVHKVDELKLVRSTRTSSLFSPQSGWFIPRGCFKIMKSTGGRIYQVDDVIIIKSTSGRIYY